jgi:ribonuclease HII
MSWLGLLKNRGTATHIIGIDEVGLGCIAGPLTVCAVCVPFDWTHEGLNDSKKISQGVRERLSYELITQRQVFFAVRYMPSFLIDSLGVRQALLWAYSSAAGAVADVSSPDKYLVVLDGDNTLKDSSLHSECLPKADGLIPAVMAASIIAKVHRDSTMQALHEQFPLYGWDKSKGYPTKDHLEALKKYGVSPVHRRSYGPVRDLVEKKE